MKTIKVFVLTLALGLAAYVYASDNGRAAVGGPDKAKASAVCCKADAGHGHKTPNCCQPASSCCVPGAECCQPASSCCAPGSACCETGTCAGCAKACCSADAKCGVAKGEAKAGCGGCGTSCKKAAASKS